MNVRPIRSAVLLLVPLIVACSAPKKTLETTPPVAPAAPVGAFGDGEPALDRYDGLQPTVVDLQQLDRRRFPLDDLEIREKRSPYPRKIVPPAEAERLRREARKLPPDATVQDLARAGGGPDVSFLADAIDAADNADVTGGLITPPDPELAVGPDHLIAAVNQSFAILDKTTGNRLDLVAFDTFFDGIGCGSFRFDPNTLYDEAEDRFMIGVSDGGNYCVAVTQTGDPTGLWNAYAIPTDVGGAFFDYPHAGVGDLAIYVGANMFGADFEGRVWAIDKNAMYAGLPTTAVSHSTGFDATPQPMNAHGFAQGTWPAGDPHYIITDPGGGSAFTVWSWTDPFGSDDFVRQGDLVFPGGSQGFPIAVDAPGGVQIGAIDWRTLDAEYRNGDVWITHQVSCNPGGGTVNCIQWAEVDPSAMVVKQGGVFSRSGGHYLFPDLAVNHCDDMIVGYSGITQSFQPSIVVGGRLSGTPQNLLVGDALVKRGEADFFSYDTQPYRWGDYTGATSDPNGQDLWYLGEYSKDTGVDTRWATGVGRVALPSCAVP